MMLLSEQFRGMLTLSLILMLVTTSTQSAEQIDLRSLNMQDADQSVMHLAASHPRREVNLNSDEAPVTKRSMFNFPSIKLGQKPAKIGAKKLYDSYVIFISRPFD